MPDDTPSLLGRQTRFASQRFALADETWRTRDGDVARPVIRHPGAVVLLAQPDAGHLVLVRQWRYPIRRWTLELPAGTRVPGEHPAATAARELQEEVGYRARRLELLGSLFPAVGVSDELMLLYRAVGLEDVAAGPEPGELASRAVVALAELPALVAAGAVCDAKTLLALPLLGLPLTLPMPATCTAETSP